MVGIVMMSCRAQAQSERHRIVNRLIAEADSVSRAAGIPFVEDVLTYIKIKKVLAVPLVSNGKKVLLREPGDPLNINPVLLTVILKKDTATSPELARLIEKMGTTFIISNMHSVAFYEEDSLSAVWSGIRFIHSAFNMYLLGTNKQNTDIAQTSAQYAAYNLDCDILDAIGGEQFKVSVEKCFHYMKSHHKNNGDTLKLFTESLQYVDIIDAELGPYIEPGDKLFRRSLLTFYLGSRFIEHFFPEQDNSKRTADLILGLSSVH